MNDDHADELFFEEVGKIVDGVLADKVAGHLRTKKQMRDAAEAAADECTYAKDARLLTVALRHAPAKDLRALRTLARRVVRVKVRDVLTKKAEYVVSRE